MRASSFLPRRLLVVGCALVALLGSASLAEAQFTASASSGPMGVSTATLNAPTAPSGSCSNGTVTVRWTATSSAFADGYDVQRGTKTGGPYGTVVHVAGRGTVSYAQVPPQQVKYYYVVRATKAPNWTSANTAQVMVDASNC